MRGGVLRDERVARGILPLSREYNRSIINRWPCFELVSTLRVNCSRIARIIMCESCARVLLKQQPLKLSRRDIACVRRGLFFSPPPSLPLLLCARRGFNCFGKFDRSRSVFFYAPFDPLSVPLFLLPLRERESSGSRFLLLRFVVANFFCGVIDFNSLSLLPALLNETIEEHLS